MDKFIWLLGLAPEVVKLIRAVVEAVRNGDERAAREAAERAAIVHAFRLAQIAARKQRHAKPDD